MNKLTVWNYNVAGDFGITCNIPIWQDNANIPNFDELINKVKTDIIDENLHASDYDETKLSHWRTYNVFEFDLPVINEIKQQIIRSYYEFLQEYKVEAQEELWIHGWVTILTKGVDLGIHNHSLDDKSYLSGSINLTPCDNSTNFVSPRIDLHKDHTVFKIKNFVGSLNIFPSWVFHYVEPVKEDLRLTLAFDLFTRDAVDFYKENRLDTYLTIRKAIRLI